jgi:hypothetical protein
MLFNSLEFLVFFPVVALLHFLLPQRWRTPQPGGSSLRHGLHPGLHPHPGGDDRHRLRRGAARSCGCRAARAGACW